MYLTYFHRRLKKRINRKTAARPCNIEERMFSKMQFLKWSVYSPVLFSVRTLYFPFNEDYPKLQQFNMVGSFNLTLKTRKILIITERRLYIRVARKIAGPMTICALTKVADACRVL